MHPVSNDLGGVDVLSLPIGSNPLTNLYRLSITGWVVQDENWGQGVIVGADK